MALSPPRRKEEPSPGQERAGSAPPPRRAPRGPSASLVQWFLTVQQFSSIIVKCLGPLDQRGPGIGRQRRRPAAPAAEPAGAGEPPGRPRRRSRSRAWGRAGAGGSGPARPGLAAPGTGEESEGRAQDPPLAAGPAPGMAERAKTLQVP